MKFSSLLFIFLVLVILSAGTASAATLASDNFNRANNTDLGADWYETYGENAIENMTLHMTDNSNHGVIWSTDSFSGDRQITFPNDGTILNSSAPDVITGVEVYP